MIIEEATMKTLTVRMSEDDYKRILQGAKKDHRTLSNFMLASTLRSIEKAYYTGVVETESTLNDKMLMEGIEQGHKDAKKKRGKRV